VKVLFCGGPADGRWMDLAPDTTLFEVVAPPTPLEFVNGTGTLARFKYKVWGIQLLGYHMMVAAPLADHNESDSVLYAVLRRDVADALKGRT
jgi:hypothetical protein